VLTFRFCVQIEPQEIDALLNGDETKLAELYSKIPTTEAPRAAEALSVYFVHFGKANKLLDFVVTSEAKAAQSDGHLFLRTPTVGTRVIQQLFAICGGEELIKRILAPRLQKVVDGNLDFEIGAEALTKRGVPADQIEAVQQKNLAALSEFISEVLDSVIERIESEAKSDEYKEVPEMLYRICSAIRKKVSQNIENYDAIAAASAFVFLRTVCPAIISPVSNDHNYVLPHVTSLTPEVRRSLILTAKVIQNISTGSKREKEKWMTLTYDLTDKYHDRMRSFIADISAKEFASEEIKVNVEVQGAGSAYKLLTQYFS
jgi:hypothetical protein